MKLFKLTLFIIILMFTFLSKSNANYEKLFYDFEIKSLQEYPKVSNFISSHFLAE